MTARPDRQPHRACPPHEAEGFSVAVLRGLPAFLGMKDEWDDLFERAARPHNVFQSYAFLRHWARHYAGDAPDILIVTGRRGGRLAMAWPLVRSRRFGVDLLEFMGAPTAQFFDLLAEPQTDRQGLFDAAWTEIRALGADAFVARNVRQDTTLFECGSGLMTALPGATSAPFARLAERVDGDAPGGAYSARERSNYRRRLRRIAEDGELSFPAFGPGPEAVALAVRSVDYKRQSLLAKSIWSPTVMNPRFGAFFESLAMDGESAIRVSTIACNGQPIGIDLSFDCRGHTFGHVLASDPACTREGIGSLLVHRTFMSAAARGATIFELMAPADPYKMQHADGQMPVFNLGAAFSRRGRLYFDLYLGRAEHAAKAAARRFVAPLVARVLAARRRLTRPASSPAPIR